MFWCFCFFLSKINMLWKEVALRSSDISSCAHVFVNWIEKRCFVLSCLSWMKRWERKCVLANRSRGCQNNCSCLSTYSALRAKTSQGSTRHFLNLSRSRSYSKITVRNCFFRSRASWFSRCTDWSVASRSMFLMLFGTSLKQFELRAQTDWWHLGRWKCTDKSVAGLFLEPAPLWRDSCT